MSMKKSDLDKMMAKKVGGQMKAAGVAGRFGQGVADVVDPLAGSYLVETLTDELERLAVAYLGAATVALFLFVLVVVQRWTASSTSYVFVLMPVVAVTLGALVADEQITATTILGGAIVFAGVYLGALAGRGAN